MSLLIDGEVVCVCVSRQSGCLCECVWSQTWFSPVQLRHISLCTILHLIFCTVLLLQYVVRRDLNRSGFKVRLMNEVFIDKKFLAGSG